MAVTTQNIATLVGTTFDGQQMVFRDILNLYLDADRFTPADSLECRVLDPLLGNQKFSTMKLQLNGTTVFDGIVDVQSRTIGQKGTYTTFSCRSQSALMIDNEVRPYWYMRLSSQQLLRTHALPYGAKGGNFPYEVTLPEILAKKGLSHWGFIEQFCRMAYQRRPYINAQGIISCQPFGETMHRFSNADLTSIPFVEAEILDDRYQMISKLYIKTGKGEYGGNYQQIINNAGAQGFGIVRERYYHPSTEGEGNPVLSGKALMEDKQLDYFEIALQVSGLPAIAVGDSAEFYDGTGWFKNLFVSQIRQSSDSNGLTTKLKLWSKRAVLNG